MPQAPEITGVVLYAPDQVPAATDLTDDMGWWVSAALASTSPSDRLIIYRTQADQGLVAVFDAATAAFEFDELGYAAYGRHILLPKPVPRQTLLADPLLERVFSNLAGRRYVDRPAAQRLAGLLPPIPLAQCVDPVPDPGDSAWHWTPNERRWGKETAASDAISSYTPAWSTLGFGSPPTRERSPGGSLRRCDLKGRAKNGTGIIAEVKHLAALSTLQQLDRYLSEARHDGSQWIGHLLALHAHTGDLERAVGQRRDVTVWHCERNGTNGLLIRKVV